MTREIRFDGRPARTCLLFLEILEDRLALSGMGLLHSSPDNLPITREMAAHVAIGRTDTGSRTNPSQTHHESHYQNITQGGTTDLSSSNQGQVDEQATGRYERDPSSQNYSSADDAEQTYHKTESASQETARPILFSGPVFSPREISPRSVPEKTGVEKPDRGPAMLAANEKKMEDHAPAIPLPAGPKPDHHEVIIPEPTAESRREDIGPEKTNRHAVTAELSVDLTAALSVPFDRLVPGMLALELAPIERALDDFFSQLEHLGENFPDLPALVRLTPWLLAAAVATSTFELARRQFQLPQAASFSVAVGGIARDGIAFSFERTLTRRERS